ncbi:MAG: hypothetical protein A4E52_00065 [Pelotomaculum sp. PtaB.Bin013]|nr:MAG: hypothetical protein A4E52_00065 [Pelotomaculum sp. PtaB.Bin013]
MGDIPLLGTTLKKYAVSWGWKDKVKRQFGRVLAPMGLKGPALYMPNIEEMWVLG